MKLQAQIDALEGLATLDGTLAELEAELASEGKVLSEKRDQLEQLEEKLRSTEVSVSDMERMRNELLQDARQMSLQMDRSREKLARSRTEREVNAVQREMEELRKLYRDREVEIEKISALAEQARGDLQATQAQREALRGELGESESELSSKLSGLEARVATEREKRAGLVAAVPKVLYRRYEMIRKRRGSAVAWTRDGTCSACHISISPMMFQKLRREEELDQCPSCQRILYFNEQPEPEAPDETDEGEPAEESEA